MRSLKGGRGTKLYRPGDKGLHGHGRRQDVHGRRRAGGGSANLGAHFTATGAIPLTINVSFKAELASGATTDAAKQEATEGIEAYFKGLVLDTAEAADIIVRVSAVGAILSGLQTILDYSELKLNGAAVNISPGEDGVPVIGEVSIS